MHVNYLNENDKKVEQVQLEKIILRFFRCSNFFFGISTVTDEVG